MVIPYLFICNWDNYLFLLITAHLTTSVQRADLRSLIFVQHLIFVFIHLLASVPDLCLGHLFLHSALEEKQADMTRSCNF